jgi:hypothetical protein
LRSLIKVAGALRRALPAKYETASPVHAAIPPVLDGIVASAMEPPRDLSPPLPHLTNQALNLESFFGADGLMVQRGLEVLVISLPALLG